MASTIVKGTIKQKVKDSDPQILYPKTSADIVVYKATDAGTETNVQAALRTAASTASAAIPNPNPQSTESGKYLMWNGSSWVAMPVSGVLPGIDQVNALMYSGYETIGWQALLHPESGSAVLVYDGSTDTPKIKWNATIADSFISSASTWNGKQNKLTTSNSITISDANVIAAKVQKPLDVDANGIKLLYSDGLTTDGDDTLIVDGTKVAVLDSNQKVKLANLPDVVMGQMLYGGTVSIPEPAGENVVKAELSTEAQTRLKQKASLQSIESTVILLNQSANDTSTTPKSFGWDSNQGIYYIVSSDFTFAKTDTGEALTLNAGDWLLATGGDKNGWKKVDHTDSISAVKLGISGNTIGTIINNGTTVANTITVPFATATSYFNDSNYVSTGLTLGSDHKLSVSNPLPSAGAAYNMLYATSTTTWDKLAPPTASSFLAYNNGAASGKLAWNSFDSSLTLDDTNRTLKVTNAFFAPNAAYDIRT